MAPVSNIGKYQLRQTIGEGTFAKVKLAVDNTGGHNVAVKVIDKQMVMESNLKYQANLSFCFSFEAPFPLIFPASKTWDTENFKILAS